MAGASRQQLARFGAARLRVPLFHHRNCVAVYPHDSMAMVRYFPAEGTPVIVALHKPVTTLGRALGNDIAVPDASVAHIFC